MTKKKICDRCGADVSGRIGAGKDQLFTYEYVDDYGEKHKIKVCWDCDWELMNDRGTPDEDPGEIMLQRWERDYEADPINTDPPPY